ncbi:MAG TPA: nickel pincer cofactor biosynthesis protein LarC [Nitrososphaeraceae archaeon]|nr:nickel pincer cofactor biosynthesis protein LarC [Nitrososphaeraceae archaeon]
MSKISIIDAQLAGLSGDMILSALIDLGADKKKVIDSIYKCENILSGSKIKEARFEKVNSNGFNATRFCFEYNEKVYKKKGIDMVRDLTKSIEYLDLKPRSKSFILDSLKSLINAEATIHGEPVNEVHLHEASSIDTFVDLIGCAIALEDLNIFESKIFSTYICIGNGLTTFSHGTIPNPTNAVLEIFRGKPFVLVGNDLGEVTTPTGAAMLVNLSPECISYYPPIIPEKIGLGAGHKILNNTPNILRIVLGKNPLSFGLNNEKMFLIETNIDDVDGEIIGNLIEVLMNEGARDVTVIPGITKKNRPVNIIRVLSDNFKREILVERLFKETGTSGIRINEINRITLERNIIIMQVIVNKSEYNIKVKITKDSSNNIINIKPEFDDLKKISILENSSLKTIQEMVMYQIYKKFKASNNE